MKEYFKLVRFLKPHISVLVLASICMFFTTIFDGVSLTMIVPLADKVLTNKQIVLNNKVPAFLTNFIAKINTIPSLELLKMMSVIVLVLFLVKGFFAFWQGYLMSDIGQRVIRDIRFLLYQKLQVLSLDYYSQKRSGELISRITNDVRVIENAVSYGFTDLVYQSLQVALFTFLVFFIYFRLAIVAIALFIVLAIPMIFIGSVLRKLSKSSQEKMADINSLLLETITGVRIVKAFCMEEYETKRFGLQNRDFYKLTMKSIKRSLALNPLTEFIGVVAAIFVFFWVGRDVIAGKISFGVFGLFLGSLMSLIRPVKKLIQVNALNQQALAASARIYEVLDARPSIVEKPQVKVLETIKDVIVFEDVWFKYEPEAGFVLKDINLKINVGEVVAIVGPTGAGKTTIVNLLPRFYDPQQGRITIDDIDLKDMVLKSLRSQIGIVTQETILFNDTVRANIAYGHLEAGESQIIDTAKKAFAHNFIMNLPNGYNTIIGDRGFKLSGGEKQRLAIARAILKNPPILILDEATSQLDSESERLVQEALDELMRHRTVLCIAHRLSTIKKATNIVVVNEARIVGLGSHDDLMINCPLYKKLYETQFQM
ncbi:MAG: ABC transporter ATP-binding protein [Candidatus Omnitrophota bacterium]|nr:ABC transporter ATP-binding protein [Candidatus Omnitrophota bacterium]